MQRIKVEAKNFNRLGQCEPEFPGGGEVSVSVRGFASLEDVHVDVALLRGRLEDFGSEIETCVEEVGAVHREQNVSLLLEKTPVYS